MYLNEMTLGIQDITYEAIFCVCVCVCVCVCNVHVLCCVHPPVLLRGEAETIYSKRRLWLCVNIGSANANTTSQLQSYVT